jgi:hypothetical protein
LNKDVHPVRFIVGGLPVAFTFKDMLNFYVIAQQFAQKTFQDSEIGFVSQ